jgi:hypothetical protein
MTEEIAAAVSKVVSSPFLFDDPLFDLNTTEWIVPPHLIAQKDDSSADLKRRQQNEHVYRSKIKDPSHWHRYLVLGRYAMSGPAFDMLMKNPVEQEMIIHMGIWYNYAFHVDRNMECSPKLAAWAVQKSKPYLTTHQPNALLVDTSSTSWKQYKNAHVSPSDTKVRSEKNLVDLTNDTDSTDTKLITMNAPPDEYLSDFTVDDWIDPPVYVTYLPVTSSDSDIRAMAEAEYKKSTTPMAWHRFLTLGRYVVDGFTFDSIMEDGLRDPLKMHCLIWYQYSYHLD